MRHQQCCTPDHTSSYYWKGKMRLRYSHLLGFTLPHRQRGGNFSHPPPTVPVTCVFSLLTPGSPNLPELPLRKTSVVVASCQGRSFQAMANDENGKGWKEPGRLPCSCVVLHFTLTHVWLFWEKPVLWKYNSSFSPEDCGCWFFFNLLNFAQEFFPCWDSWAVLQKTGNKTQPCKAI